MKQPIKFTWNGSKDSEDGLAIFQIGSMTYSEWFPNFKAAQFVNDALTNAYQKGYEDGIQKTKSTIQFALSKIPE